MDTTQLPLFIVLCLSVVLAAVMLVLSNMLGPRRPSAIKSAPFECGNVVEGGVLDRFNVKFYLVAILFLVFDIEAVFIYPWAVLWRQALVEENTTSALTPLTMGVEMFTFVATLAVGLCYAWRKGTLLWSDPDT